jgi:ornithine decarboxylase
VLLRIRADDASARCQLGNKYGCEPGEDAVAMLRTAHEFRLNVTGVSFHVVSPIAPI